MAQTTSAGMGNVLRSEESPVTMTRQDGMNAMDGME